MSDTAEPVDVVLVGGGIMSATLGSLIKQLEPDWTIQIFERLGEVAMESSNPWNNAGTGHAALCELNYTPEKDGKIEIGSATRINEQFQLSRQFWAHLVTAGAVPEPKEFINPTPHMTFVRGTENAEFLRRRFDAMRAHPLFEAMEYSEDPAVIHSWAPLLVLQREKDEVIAATRFEGGTDVDFGALTNKLIDYLTEHGAALHLNHEVRGLSKNPDGTWHLRVRNDVGRSTVEVDAKFVFIGAGGGALHLLQKSGIPEIKGFGGFPISGEWFRTDDPEIVAKHRAKVYGKAAIGSPPMSVPHLDTRVVGGETSLLFGPYAGFSPRFLKKGSLLDLFTSIRPHNIIPMLAVAKDNLSLIKYLVGQLIASKETKFDALREFMPTADPKDWYQVTAGQRVQVMKKDAQKGGVLQFGTEVVAAADGSIAGLLGASPGASTAVPIMLDVLERCFPDRIDGWKKPLRRMIPNYGTLVASDPKKTPKIIQETAEVLELQL
ncbi:malate:quinone oxidoreductase [Clavibacter sp. VKM Ac-2872]|uniref:malate:quinone oxidoreductase n=1 Tax=Clavibacter sp. VKM Ac-2872 TaxID=2783812 RepID=UPI00188D54A3|nr:malate:quinone oxidoreductase [Clavibacter sp. VKM Ac-2872]